MAIFREPYPGSRDDLRRVLKWVTRKATDRLQGREYIFDRQDFLDLARGIRYGNWMAARFAHTRWYQGMLDGMFGPVEAPKIQSRIIPLNVRLEKSKNAVVPHRLLDDFIDSAGFRIIIDECLCRKGMDCSDYPIDIGCIMLGEGARTMLKGGHGREVTAEEAKAQVRRAEKHGLVPIAAHAKGEEQVMGIPEDLRHKFIEICFCCPCCCIAMKNLKHFTPDVQKHNLVNVAFVAKALPDCKGCNACVEACPADAIKVNGKKVWVQEDACIGCGVCCHACKHDAIELVQVGKSRPKLMDYFGGLQLDLS